MNIDSKALAHLEQLEAKMPEALREQARTVSEADLTALVLEKAVGQIHVLADLFAQASKRCGVCETNGKVCAHCIAEGEQLDALMTATVTLALLCKVATSPGSRIAAERERRAENAAEEYRHSAAAIRAEAQHDKPK